MIYCWDSLSCLHHPPLTFSSCRLFPSRAFCLLSLTLSHSSMGLVLNPHLSHYHSLHLSLCTAVPIRNEARERTLYRTKARDFYFPPLFPFRIEAWVLRGLIEWVSAPALTTEQAEDPCLDCLSESLRWNHCLIESGSKEKCCEEASDKCGLCGEEVGWLKEQK